MARWERPLRLGEAAAGLRALADALDAGHGPRPGQGLRRVEGIPVVPRAVHDALCGWRVATPQDTVPQVLGCAGCGLGVLADETGSDDTQTGRTGTGPGERRDGPAGRSGGFRETGTGPDRSGCLPGCRTAPGPDHLCIVRVGVVAHRDVCGRDRRVAVEVDRYGPDRNVLVVDLDEAGGWRDDPVVLPLERVGELVEALAAAVVRGAR